MKKVVTFFQNHWEKIVALIAVILLVISVVVFVCAKKSGEVAGDALAVGMGKAVGSFEGIKDASENYNEGKEEGLGAKDTEAEFASEIRKISKLQVLVAGVKVENFHKQNSTNPFSKDKLAYASLTVQEGQAVFTVDLTKMHIKENLTTINVKIPEPECEVYIDSATSEVIGTYERTLFNGTTENGLKGAENSEKEMREKINEKVKKNSDLHNQAKERALAQVTEMLNSVNTTGKTINVTFIEEKGDE